MTELPMPQARDLSLRTEDVHPSCDHVTPRVASGVGEEASSAVAYFSALGVDWPGGPQFLVAPGDSVVEAKLLENLQLLLQIDPLPYVEIMREHLATCTRGYHAFGFPRTIWMPRLETLWAEFALRHVTEARKLRIQTMIRWEEEELSRVRAQQEQMSAQVAAAQERLQVASERVAELAREVETLLQRAREAEAARDHVRVEVEGIQREVTGLQEVILRREAHVTELRAEPGL